MIELKKFFVKCLETRFIKNWRCCINKTELNGNAAIVAKSKYFGRHQVICFHCFDLHDVESTHRIQLNEGELNGIQCKTNELNRVH